MKTILFVNACYFQETSRTQRLADALLSKKLEDEPEAEVVEISLIDAGVEPLDEETLAFRTKCCEAKDFSHPMFDIAKQWRAADEIVIAAPYWDLSSPSILKAYVEHLCVNGLTFTFGDDGRSISHCLANKLTYVTTSGGYIGDLNLGFDYVSAVSKLFFGVREFECIAAEGFDIVGNDPEAILADAIAKL